MATHFSSNDGSLVVVRSWGGESEGVRVSLQPGAARVGLDEELRGDDGSTHTLRELAREAGRGGHVERLRRSVGEVPDARDAYAGLSPEMRKAHNVVPQSEPTCWTCGDELTHGRQRARRECRMCERDRCES